MCAPIPTFGRKRAQGRVHGCLPRGQLGSWGAEITFAPFESCAICITYLKINPQTHHGTLEQDRGLRGKLVKPEPSLRSINSTVPTCIP